jgi:hypothetical protein
MEPPLLAGAGSLGLGVDAKSDVARGEREPTLPALVLIIVVVTEDTKVVEGVKVEGE